MKITNKNIWTILISLGCFLIIMILNFCAVDKISNDALRIFLLTLLSTIATVILANVLWEVIAKDNFAKSILEQVKISENIAQSGLDFIYLDLEHTNYQLDEAFEKQIMAAKLHDIAILVRMADDDEVAIRKVLEWGADGVVIPHCKTAEMARRCVEAAKFYPLGRRGGESNVRAAGFGYNNFDWNKYIEQQNRDTLVIPMDEDFEFSDNIDEILAVPGIDAVNFGPIDYANSLGLKIGYSMGKEVNEAFDLLVKKCKEKGIGVLGPVVPPTPENLRKNIEAGYSMIILGNDMWHFQKALKELVANSVEPVRNDH